MFNPKSAYDIQSTNYRIEEFHKYKADYVVRPPYQRKSVWSTAKQRALLDSLFRRYYVPRLVLREVRISDDRTKMEVIDGQQRITVVQQFFADELSLPKSLGDFHTDLPGRYYSDLPTELQRFVETITFQIDIVKGIDDMRNREHQVIATEIFRRLQEGESLNYMEKAHARLSSRVRNFVVKYGDDIRFDYETYEPIDENPDKHPFLARVYNRDNERMPHLAFLVRLLLIELADGPTDTKNSDVTSFIEESEHEEGIGDFSYEDTKEAKAILSNLSLMYDIFKNDPMIDENSGMREFSTEYFVLSVYMLLRHLKTHYVFDEAEKDLFYRFTRDFFQRWNNREDKDTDILLFANNRQQSRNETETRHRIIRQIFFEYAAKQGHEMLTKDKRRAFSEAERIEIYRQNDGLCQMCLEEGKPRVEAQVSWSEFEADHIIAHTNGGSTAVFNGQVLCRTHNRSKGAS